MRWPIGRGPSPDLYSPTFQEVLENFRPKRILVAMKEKRGGKLSAASVEKNVCTVFFVFGCAFLVFGLWVLFVFLVKPLYEYGRGSSWVETTAVVLDSELRSISGRRSGGYSKPTVYNVDASYRYVYEGKEYINDRIGFYDSMAGSSAYWLDQFKRLEQARSQEASVTAWVNPAQPHQSYLERRLGIWVSMFGLVLGGAFLCVGRGLLRIRKP